MNKDNMAKMLLLLEFVRTEIIEFLNDLIISPNIFTCILLVHGLKAR